MWAHRLASRVTEKVQRRRSRRQQQRNGSNRDILTEPTIETINNPNTTDDNAEDGQISEDGFTLSLLYCLCQRWAWGAIEFRCETHPHEADATYVDRDGSTALHWAVFGNPPATAIEALLKACPALAHTPNNKGQLPIHMAAQFRASGEVFRVLMRAFPRGALLPSPSRDKACALHIMADRGNTFDAFRAILEFPEGARSLKVSEKPTALFHSTPLTILNTQKPMYPFHSTLTMLRDMRRTQLLLRTACEETGFYDEEGMQKIENEIDRAKEDEFWRKAEIMIHVEYTGEVLTDDTDVSTRIVHAVAGIECCPSSLEEMALLLYREQLSEPDEGGKLPLHLAAADWRKRGVTHDILMAYPEAARIPDGSGKYPFHYLIESCPSSPWRRTCIGDLLCAHGSVLETLKLDDRLYPHVWWKLLEAELDGHQGVYESLRAKPSIVPSRL